MLTMRYKGCWTIQRRWVSDGKPQPDEWEAWHDDYDGPEDNRALCAPTHDVIMDLIHEFDE